MEGWSFNEDFRGFLIAPCVDLTLKKSQKQAPSCFLAFDLGSVQRYFGSVLRNWN